MRFLKLVGICGLLSGCATASFAPPSVNLARKSTISTDSGTKCSPVSDSSSTAITEDEDGARALINNFILVYRCSAHQAANGRQIFEVPNLLVAAGTVTAAAFGAGPNVAIAGGATSAILSNGKSYYSPQQKAQFFDHALDALLCIKTEAVGVSPFTAQMDSKKGLPSGGRTVKVPASRRYYEMVTASLFSVERILSQRLSTAGQFDPAGLIAEIEAVKKKVDEAEAAKKKKLEAGTSGGGEDSEGSGETDGTEGAADTSTTEDLPDVLTMEDSAPEDPKATASELEAAKILLMARLLGANSSSVGEAFDLDLDVLQPKLQQCVIRAKL